MKKGLSWAGVYLCIAIMFLVVVAGANRSITAIAENIPIDGRITLIIDAGHGGEDCGAVSCTGRWESTCNLEIATRLCDLMRFLGGKIVMVRSDDRSVYTSGSSLAQKKVSDLKYRVNLVNETENCLLLSIHQNTFPDGKYSGAQVFYAKDVSSRQLAEQLQSDLITTLNKGSNRKSKPAEGIYLMQNIQKSGILIECGFLSNAQEEQKLFTPDYQKKLCSVIASTTLRFLSNT